MTDPKGHNPRSSPSAELLRRAADGELSPEEYAEFSGALASSRDARASVEFERELRRRVGSVMQGDEDAPAELRARIVDALRAEAPPVHRRTDPAFWQRAASRLAAVAALLLIVAGLYIVVRSPLVRAPGEDGLFATPRTIVASFISSEHDRCAELSEYLQKKVTVTDPDDAARLLKEDLGAAPERLVIEDEGFRFAGLGRCAVPGEGRSAHLLYRSMEDPDVVISLFIQEDRGAFSGALNLCEKVPVSVGHGRGQILVWRKGGLIYYLCSPNPDGAGATARAFGAPLAALRP